MIGTATVSEVSPDSLAQRLLSFRATADISNFKKKMTFEHEILYRFRNKGEVTFEGADSLVDLKARHPHSSVWNMVF